MPKAKTIQPQHIAIIMDGNGRWAEKKGLPRELGHSRGAEAVERVVDACLDLQIPYVSLFCFSTENWQRPKKEVKLLMDLLRHYLTKNFQDLISRGVRVKVIGARHNLPQDIIKNIVRLETSSLHLKRMTLTLAINYGAKLELQHAFLAILQKFQAGVLSLNEINQQTIANHLWTSELPDPDLIIRSSGEHRLSNFYLWQGAYSELLFTDKLWPDIDKSDVQQWLKSYAKRQRRFGKVYQESQNLVLPEHASDPQLALADSVKSAIKRKA